MQYSPQRPGSVRFPSFAPSRPATTWALPHLRQIVPHGVLLQGIATQNCGALKERAHGHPWGPAAQEMHLEKEKCLQASPLSQLWAT